MGGLRRWGKWIVIFLVLLELGSLMQYGVADTGDSEPAFFAALQDVPIMPGLVEMEDHSFSFDKPEGKITEVAALTKGTAQSHILDFYQATLPQFGWGRVNESSFFRKNESLEISFDTEDGVDIVKILIRPSR